MKKWILTVMLIGLSNQAFSFGQEIKRLYSDVKIALSEKVSKALSHKTNLSSNEQIIDSIKKADLAALIDLASAISNADLPSFIDLADHKLKSNKVKSVNNIIGLSQVLLGCSVLVSTVLYTLCRYYNLATDNFKPFNLRNLIDIFKKHDQNSSEYIVSLTGKFLDLIIPTVAGSYLFSKGLESIQLRPSIEIKIKRLVVLTYLKSLRPV